MLDLQGRNFTLKISEDLTTERGTYVAGSILPVISADKETSTIVLQGDEETIPAKVAASVIEKFFKPE